MDKVLCEDARASWVPGKGQREEWPSVEDQWKHGAYDRGLTRSQGFIWMFWKGGLYGMKARRCEDCDRPVGSDGDAWCDSLVEAKGEYRSLH